MIGQKQQPHHQQPPSLHSLAEQKEENVTISPVKFDVRALRRVKMLHKTKVNGHRPRVSELQTHGQTARGTERERGRESK